MELFGASGRLQGVVELNMERIVPMKQWIVSLALVCMVMLGVSAVAAQEPEMPIPMAMGTFESAPLDVALDADGSLLYVVHADGTLGIYSVGVNDAFMPITDPIPAGGISYQPVALAISPDGTRLYVANSGFIGRSLLSPITVWNIESASGLLNFGGRFGIPSSGSGLTSIAVSADGGSLIVGGAGENGAAVFNTAAIPTVVTMTLAPYMLPCMGVGPMLCPMVIDSAGVQLYFYNAIEGFTFQWGHPVTLRVQVEQVANPPADGSSRRYTLVEVVEDAGYQPGATFEARVPMALIMPVSEGRYSLGGMVEFGCATEAQCSGLASFLDQPIDIPMTFTFPEVEGEPLLADFQAPMR